MENFIRSSSSYTRIVLHISFKVKYCHRVFDNPKFRNRCEEIFKKAEKDTGIAVQECGFAGDHVHMVWHILPKQSISEIAKIFKGRSGWFLLKEFPEIKKQFFWSSGLWAGTIYADSLGKNPEGMRNYVRKQGGPKISPNQTQLSKFMPPVSDRW